MVNELQNKVNEILNEIVNYIENKFQKLNDCELRGYDIKFDNLIWIIEVNYGKNGKKIETLFVKSSNIENLFDKVKEDFMCEHTGNVSLEYESRGKLSGISVSEADYYIYKLHVSRTEIIFAIISSDILKEYIADKAFFRIVNGGDKGSNTLNYLFKYEKFIRKASLYKLYKP